jgi:hypothetical protein
MADVLQPQLPDGQPYFSPSPLRRSSPSSSFLVGSPPSFHSNQTKSSAETLEYVASSLSSSAPSSTTNSQLDLSLSSSLPSSSSSSLSLDTGFDLYSDDDDDDDDEDDTVSLPSYSSHNSRNREDDEPPLSPKSTPEEGLPATPDALLISEDDTAVRHEPSHHVDYLSHDWQEEDIWASWRHIVSKRKLYGERSRLENASWRTWAKSKYKLKTVSPETLNW